MKSNPTNTNYWPEWEEEYNPKKTIKNVWYTETTRPIDTTELKIIINKSPLNKATRPFYISNKMLKHLRPKALSLFLTVLNLCLKTQDVPKK